jgi:tagatose 6-phosphate kinase
VARLRQSFGHDVLAAGLAGGASGELIIQDLARSGVPTAFTLIRGESRRFFRFSDPESGGSALRFSEPGPYITTEELGRLPRTTGGCWRAPRPSCSAAACPTGCPRIPTGRW